MPRRIKRGGNLAKLGGQIQRKGADQFKATQPFGKMVFNAREQIHGSLNRVYANPRGCHGLRRGKQFQRCACNHAERAFAADKQMARFVARGVFMQRRQVVQQLAVGQYHFQPQHQIAHRAIAQHV